MECQLRFEDSHLLSVCGEEKVAVASRKIGTHLFEIAVFKSGIRIMIRGSNKIIFMSEWEAGVRGKLTRVGQEQSWVLTDKFPSRLTGKFCTELDLVCLKPSQGNMKISPGTRFAGEIAQLSTYFPCKCGVLSSDPQNPCRKLSMPVHTQS